MPKSSPAERADRGAAEAPADIRYALMSPVDLDAIVALHKASIAAVGRNDLIKPETPDFFERILSGSGRITGVWRDGELVGYGVLQLDLPASEDARPYFGLASGDRLAKLAGACVLPHAWGGGIHDDLIRLRVEQAFAAEVPHLYATAAPGNARSWENLIAWGFAIRAIVTKYGGHLRYLLYRRDGVSAVPEGGGAGIWVAADDMRRQQTLLGEGLWGWGWRRREDGGRDVSYRKWP